MHFLPCFSSYFLFIFNSLLKCNVLVPNKSVLKNKIPCVVLFVKCDMIIIARKMEIVTLWSK